MSFRIEEVSAGVFMMLNGERGPGELDFEGQRLFRFMDCFYIRKQHLDELSPEEVKNLCRVRENFPGLIDPANSEVHALFARLIERIQPRKLLEIGAGTRPVLAEVPPYMDYVLSDADRAVFSDTEGVGSNCHVFSGSEYKLPHSDSYFEMVVAVFVLQFPFYKEQIAELYRCLAPSGIVVANMYRRTELSRERLAGDFECAGFKLYKLPDIKSLCRGHEYWILGKDYESVMACGKSLEELMGD
ncbi:class I SAM-dependent methyltransferase [Azotobacter salinestris]